MISEFTPELWYCVISNYGNSTLFTAEVVTPSKLVTYARYQKNAFTILCFEDYSVCEANTEYIQQNISIYVKHKVTLSNQLNDMDNNFMNYMNGFKAKP